MRTDKTKAIKLRLEGKSYGEIQKTVRASKSTLSMWLRDIVISVVARRRIEKKTHVKSIAGLLKKNIQQTQDARERCRKIRSEASVETTTPSKETMLFIGAALYWAEGHKRPLRRGGREVTYHAVSITNSDPVLAKAFLLFLRDICSVPENRITANVRVFENMNSEIALRYWMKETGIPRKNFSKTYVGTSRSSMNKRPFNRLPYGVIQVRVNDTNLFHRIMGWIEGLKKQILALDSSFRFDDVENKRQKSRGSSVAERIPKLFGAFHCKVN